MASDITESLMEIKRSKSPELIELDDEEDVKMESESIQNEETLNGNNNKIPNAVNSELAGSTSNLFKNEYQLVDEVTTDKINLNPIDMDSSIISSTNPNENLIVNHTTVATEPTSSNQIIISSQGDNLTKVNEQKDDIDGPKIVRIQPNIIKVPLTTPESKVKTLTLKLMPPINGVKYGTNPIPSGNTTVKIIKQEDSIKSSSPKVTSKPTIQLINPTPKLIINLSNGTTTVSNENKPIKPNVKTGDQPIEKTKLCIRENCNKRATKSDEWDDEYCSNECLIKHCKQVFNTWVKSRAKK